MEGFVFYHVHNYFGKLNHSTRVLDIGSGSGKVAFALAEHGASVVLLENSEPKLAQSLEVLHNAEISTYGIHSPIQDWNPDETFDIVVFCNVLHFIPKDQQTKAVKNALKALNSGGLFIFSDLVDEHPIPLTILKQISDATNLRTAGQLTIYDLPHKGADFPHKHTVEYLVGTKKPLL